MAITNTEVIKYSNEVIRPMSEKIRALKVELDSAMTTWFGTISANCPNDAGEILEDGRSTEGISILTGADITSLVVVMQSLQTPLNVAGVSDVISKPCVRPLQAS
jgi:hypothetical protein